MSSHRCAALAGALLVVVSCATLEPVQPADESLFVTLAALSEFGLELPADPAQHEKRTRLRVGGGAIRLEYEFRSPDGGPPLVYSSAELHPSPRDACLSFTAASAGLGLSRLEMIDRSELFGYGEKSRFALVVNDEHEAVGNVFAMCRSRTAMLVMFVGLYFGDAGAWRALIEPRLEALAAFEAANPAE
jgi:hypothetical protein